MAQIVSFSAALQTISTKYGVELTATGSFGANQTLLINTNAVTTLITALVRFSRPGPPTFELSINCALPLALPVAAVHWQYSVTQFDGACSPTNRPPGGP